MEDSIVPTKKKSAPKIPKDEPEKKRKSSKAAAIEPEANDDLENAPVIDQEVPVKSKKKRAPKPQVSEEALPTEEPVKKKKAKAPKIEITDETPPTEEPVKKKKSKAPKPPPVDDNDFQSIDNPFFDELETPVEQKPKVKKSKKSKKAIGQSLEDLQDAIDPSFSENNGNYTEPVDTVPSAANNASDYEQAILDAFSNLASKINFSDYVGNDQWTIIHLPKAARTDQKSRLRKMLPGGGSKEEKSTGKPAVPKGSLFSRIRSGVTTLVRDENNLLFGERSNYDMADMEEEEDGVDTDNLHRYAQKLRELEDQDREVNPEYLVLRDGKTVYGVHESDADGKVKLSTRKPIYDRQADQKPDEQSEKKKFLTIIKRPFNRNKDKDKDGKDSKSANATPDAHIRRNTSRKSLNDDLRTTAIDDEPVKI